MVPGGKPNLKQRRVMARLRAKSWSYGAIGKRLGISRQAVHHALTVPLRQPVERDRTGLARRLKDLRTAAGISRRILARKAGVDYVTVLYAEAGHSWPRRATFERVAKAIGVKVTVLTGEQPLPPSPERNDKQEKRR
jgi:lambda repressor-like predicted transcriptional regulator